MLYVKMDLVSIFDNIATFLKNAFKVLSMLIHALVSLPKIIADGVSTIANYASIFPAFVWFLVLFALGTGIICKIIKWR